MAAKGNWENWPRFAVWTRMENGKRVVDKVQPYCADTRYDIKCTGVVRAPDELALYQYLTKEVE